MAKCTGMRCPMQYGYKIEECNQTDCPYRTEPITNSDRIREMSDEELADYIVKIGWDCHFCEEHLRLDNEPLMRDEKCDEKCVRHCLEWLKQPAEGER